MPGRKKQGSSQFEKQKHLDPGIPEWVAVIQRIDGLIEQIGDPECSSVPPDTASWALKYLRYVRAVVFRNRTTDDSVEEGIDTVEVEVSQYF